MTTESFADLAARVRATPPRLGPVRLVAIDGPSGAGKTWFADRLAKHLDVPVVHTDDLLDGWDDQFTFWPRLEKQVLAPLRNGRAATYSRYLWHQGRFGSDQVIVDPGDCVILEGVSSSRRIVRTRLSLAVFVTAPADLRWKRTIERDGADGVAFRAYLERWRAAEDRHFADDRTEQVADLVVDGAATAGDDRYEGVWRQPPD
jgi:uridine kinase